MSKSPDLPDFLIDPIVSAALSEDLGQLGDITSRAVIPAGTQTTAQIVARQTGVISGLQVAKRAFMLIDDSLVIGLHAVDGDKCQVGKPLMTVSGDAISILSAERVALNFMGRLCGIASKTAEFVALTSGTDARITCTRKTTPGLRLLEKQAVLHGGGANHRFGLGDAVMIKDNHIAAAGGITNVLTRARSQISHMMRIEIEVDTLTQLDEVLAVGGADVVLLDNMDVDKLSRAVVKVGGRLVTEASGNMTLLRIAEVAATGVGYISVGALTHSVENMDIGLDI
jgi:nicotinate-nucleotide pyrophosphorylase (carboxylating)